MLKASRDLQNHEGLEDEVRGKEDEIDDRSEYERNNDAKRHANKVFLHEHVLVRFIYKSHTIVLLSCNDFIPL